MQNTTADYKIEINKPSRQFECKITIGNNIYTNEDLVNLTLEYTQPQEGFSIGGTISKSLDLTLLNRGDIIYSTSQIKVEIGLKIGSKIEYILMGIFNIDDIEKTDYTTKFTAYDNMIKFETPYFSSLGDKPTLQQVVNELSNKTGVEFTGSLPAYTVKKLDSFSCREVLSYVASICGGNAVITRDGKFTIKTLGEVEKSIDGNNYFNYTREEVKYKVGKISCQVDENNILSKGSIGTDSMELGFENQWVTETIITEIYNKLNGLSYLGYSMKWQGDLSLDPYDIITVTDVKNVVRKIPILSQKLSYTGGLTSEIGAKGETKNKNSFSSSGSTTNKVNRAVIEQAIIKEALIEKANIKDVEAVSIRTQTLEAKTAKIEEAIIDVAHISDLNAINANIQNLIAADATINNALIGKADITELNAVKGTINVLESDTANIKNLLAGNITGESGQLIHLTASNVVIADAVIKDLIASNISVQDLKTSTISTNKFSIASTDGGLSIVGPTMQFKDKNNKVRIQMGQDTQGNFNFILRGADGTTTLIDHTGIKEKAIADDLIKSNMVAADAIGEKQINYSSLITGLNKDTNTSLIKASKVAIDLTGQSLEVAFNSLKSNVDNIQVGGRNLILNSKTILLNGSDNGNKNCSIIENDYVKISPINNGNVYNTEVSTCISRIQGKTYTLTFEILTPTPIGFYWYPSESYQKFNYINASSKWQRISFTYTQTAIDKNTKTLFGLNGLVGGNIYYYRNLKLEEGNKPTGWTPAIEDIDTKIESNTTAITVAQGKIEGLIKESSTTKGDVTTLKDKYTSIKATVDGINTKVASHTSSITTIKNTADSALANANNASLKIDNLQIGGRNLIKKNSLFTYGYLNQSNGNVTNSGSLNSNQDFYNNEYFLLKKGENIYFSSYTKAGVTTNITPGVYIHIYNINKVWESAVASKATPANNNVDVYYTATKDCYIRFCARGFNVYNHKAEYGTKPTDWTPAPEDVNSAISTIDTKVTTVENKQATLEQNLNGFKTTVANTYSTKSELSGVDGKVSSLTSRVNTAESSITQLNNKIDLKVEATDITEAINNIQVGGRNLLKPIARKGSPNTLVIENGIKIDMTTSRDTYFFIDLYNEVILGETLTLSFDVSGLEGTLNMGIIAQYKNNIKLVNGRVYKTFIVDDELIADRYKGRTLLIDDITRETSSSDIRLTNFKLEKGNKSTDYTVAPEDIDSSIANVQTQVTTTSNKVATIETNLSSITQRVSSTESTVSTHTTQLGTVDSRINTAKNSAISTAANDATSKANTAQTNAINSAKTYTDGQITTVNKTITNKVAEIKATTDSITSKVEIIESTTTTINGNVTNLQSKVNTVESKITGTAIVNTISSTITGGTGSISTTQFVMDNNGLTINNGALTIKNKSGTTVLNSDTNGNLVITGEMRSQYGQQWVGLNAGGLTFQDWNRNEQMLRVGLSYFESNRDMNGVNFALAKYGDFIRFSHIEKTDLTNGWSSSDTQYNFFDCWSSDQIVGSVTYKKGINIYAPMYINNRIKFNYNGSTLYTNDIVPVSWESINGILGIYGDNGAILGYQNGSDLHARIVVTEGAHPGTDDRIKSWGHWNCSGYVVHNATFRGAFQNSYANTLTRTFTETHCIEAENKQVRINFKDIQLKNGKAILNIPNKYMYINTGYIVSSIVKKGKGDVWIAEELENRFVIEGTEDIKINIEVIINIEADSLYSLKDTDEQPLCVDMSTGQPIGA